MKKIIMLTVIATAVVKTATAQIDWGKYSQTFPDGVNDTVSKVGLITNIIELNNSFWGINSAGLLNAIKTDTAFTKLRPKDFTILATFDTAKAQFFLHGVNKSNAAQYQFRVLKDNQVISNWGPLVNFTGEQLVKSSGMSQMAYLGGYQAPLGHMIITDVRLTASRKIIATSVVYWQNIYPEIVDVYGPADLNIFLKRISGGWRIKTNEKSLLQRQNPTDIFDQRRRAARKLIVDPADNSLVFYLNAENIIKTQLEYEVVKNGDTISPWKTNDFDNPFVWLKNLAPGNYLLKIRYTCQRQHVTQFPFQVKTPWYQSEIFIIGIGIFTATFAGFIFVLLLNIRQRQRAQQELSKKTRLQLELKSIYAQLNPHFIFNALSSIQGLINKHNINGANRYLSDFAKLMRETLNTGNREHAPLKQEMDIMDIYLRLEQLRFGFGYGISTDGNIAVYETDMPTLLLQPLVENAVKHGVSDLQEKGMISVSFSRDNHNMLATITDNGRGFTTAAENKGHGLKLTHDRIKLLNELAGNTVISLEIKDNKPAGTLIVLTFTNWFL